MIILGFSKDLEVITIGSKTLRALSLFLPMLGFQIVYTALFQALGKGIPAGILSLSRQGLFLIPAIWVLPELYGLNGVIFSQPVADFFTIILTTVLAMRLKKQLIKEEKDYCNERSYKMEKEEDFKKKMIILES